MIDNAGRSIIIAMATKKKYRFRRIAALMASLLMSGTAGAGDKALTPGEKGVVESIVDGDTLFLESGLKVRLSALQAPKLSLGRDHVQDWPFSHKAKKELSDLALGQTVQLYYGGLRRDRHDRALAQVYLINGDGEKGLWLQEEMIRRGFGRVYTWPDTWQNSEALYAAEKEARSEERGIWKDPFYHVRGPEPNALAQHMDSFQIVEGIVTSSAKVKDKVFLNFGSDYRTDFTIFVNREGQKRFKKLSLDPRSLEGAKVRVRGWVEMENGPMIQLDHTERLEVLD